MMKTVLKFVGKAIKWYAVLEIMYCSYLGVGSIIKRCREHPDESSTEISSAVLDEATEEWKFFINCWRGLR